MTFRICSAEEIAVQERQQKLYERQQITNNLLTQWHQVLKEVPNVELHIFYGWQGIDALINSPYIHQFPKLPGSNNICGFRRNCESGFRIKGSAGNEQTNNAFIEGLIELLINSDKQASLTQEALALKDAFGWDKVAQQCQQEFIAV